MYISSVSQRGYILVEAYIIVQRVIVCKYGTANLYSNRAIIFRVGVGETSRSIPPHFQYYLGGLFHFLLEQQQHLPINKYLASPNQMNTKIV